MVVLAAIADKMGTFSETLIYGIVVAAFAVGLAQLKWWLSLLALPIFVLWNWGEYGQLQENPFGKYILEELGYQWVVGQFVAINTPAIAAACIVFYIRRAQIRADRELENLCQHCGYPLHSQRCPECGTLSPSAAPPS